MMLPFQGAGSSCACIPRALPWARWCCPFGAQFSFVRCAPNGAQLRYRSEAMISYFFPSRMFTSAVTSAMVLPPSLFTSAALRL